MSRVASLAAALVAAALGSACARAPIERIGLVDSATCSSCPDVVTTYSLFIERQDGSSDTVPHLRVVTEPIKRANAYIGLAVDSGGVVSALYTLSNRARVPELRALPSHAIAQVEAMTFADSGESLVFISGGESSQDSSDLIRWGVRSGTQSPLGRFVMVPGDVAPIVTACPHGVVSVLEGGVGAVWKQTVFVPGAEATSWQLTGEQFNSCAGTSAVYDLPQGIFEARLRGGSALLALAFAERVTVDESEFRYASATQVGGIVIPDEREGPRLAQCVLRRSIGQVRVSGVESCDEAQASGPVTYEYDVQSDAWVRSEPDAQPTVLTRVGRPRGTRVSFDRWREARGAPRDSTGTARP